MGLGLKKSKRSDEALEELDISEQKCRDIGGTFQDSSQKCLVRVSDRQPDGSYKVTPLPLRKSRPERPVE